MFVGKGKGEIKNLKEFVWTTIFKIFSQKYLVVRRKTRSQILVVLTQFLGVEDTKTRKFCYPVWIFSTRISAPPPTPPPPAGGENPFSSKSTCQTYPTPPPCRWREPIFLKKYMPNLPHRVQTVIGLQTSWLIILTRYHTASSPKATSLQRANESFY